MSWRWEGRTAQTQVCGVYDGLLREGKTVKKSINSRWCWRSVVQLAPFPRAVDVCDELWYAGKGRYSNEKPPTRSESWQATNQGTILGSALIDRDHAHYRHHRMRKHGQTERARCFTFFSSVTLDMASIASFPYIDLEVIPRSLPGWLHRLPSKEHPKMQH